MSEFSADLEEILALTVSPKVDGNRTLAYSKLLCLQGRSSENPSSIRALGESCGSILPHLVSDISVEDEVIAALALKCLGFMIYHPMIVAAIPGNVAGEILASIAEVARTTKMKLVCNLGMWCISMQQLDEEAIRGHFQLLVKAVVHAIDNPFGSLSTTFEAFQAVIKLADQTDQMMRESSDFWLPPTYRRLLSDDKRARDMADRCLLKIKPTVIPPTLVLFKVVLLDPKLFKSPKENASLDDSLGRSILSGQTVRIDLKDSLLLKLKEMIKDGYKIQAVHAWGWLIRLLGNYATKDRHLFNDMLKVLESAFLDSDPQVQIASQVAWQGLVEAVIPPSVTGKEKDMGKQTPDKEKFALDESRINGLLKILKLIMTPIMGIVSSQCILAVRSACFDTWCILLHKLHTLVNHQAIRTVVLKPVFEDVFRKKEDSVRNGSWDLCMDMLDHSMLPPEGRRKTLASDNVTLDSLERVMFSRSTWRQYPMKLLSFDHSQFGFYLEVIGMIIGVPQATVIGGRKDAQCAAAIRIMRSLMRVIQMDLKTSSAKYDDIMASVKSILSFVKHISEDRDLNETRQMVLHFIRAISQELEPSFLVSPLYKVTLDVKYMDQLNLVEDARHAKMLPIRRFSFGDMVCPMVYLVILYFNVLFQLNQSISDAKILEEDVSKFVRIILSSDGCSENLAIVTVFFYRYLDLAYVNLWKAVALGLRDILDGQNNSSSVQLVSACQSTIAHFLTYPVQAVAFHINNVESHKDALKEFIPSIRKDLDKNNIGPVWVSLFASISKADIEDSFGNSCTNILCWTLNDFLQRNAVRLVFSESNSNLVTHLLSLFGIMLTSVLELILTKEVYANGRPIWTGGVLPVMLRFMELLMADTAAVCPNLQDLNSRVLDSLGCVAQRINSKQDVLLFIEIFSDPLALWLSQTKSSWSDCIIRKLERLSVVALRCSTRSQPAIEFDSSLLKVQARLLEQTLRHSKQSISDPAVGLWNTTYGEQTNLDYPKALLPILDGLWRSDRIYLGNVRGMHRALTMTRNGTSKRVELAAPDHSSKQMVRKKRKGRELTEHQKEVRAAQQGRSMDCEGRGPGIRTYTMLDFSQGNEDSQEAGTSD